MARIQGRGTVKGGLPVIAAFDCGYDSFTGEHYAEIAEIYWMKKNGKKGKSITAKVWDSALAEDYGFAMLLEQVSEDVAARREDQ